MTIYQRRLSTPKTTLVTLLLVFVVFVISTVTAATNEDGLKFLAENKEKPGVITLPSGLQYKVLKKGRGTSHPTLEAPCSCHYEGKLLNGVTFDSSIERGQPSSFRPVQVIKGWTEAMQLMVVGDKWELYIPSELGYGDYGSPPKIGPGEVLIFQMEMLAINGDTVPAIKCDPTLDDEHEIRSNCDDREQAYIVKVKEWTIEKKQSEVGRVHTILQKPMTDELRDWARRRANILNLLIKKAKGEQEEL